MRHQPASGGDQRDRGILPAVLALPVLGWVYAASIVGWLRSARSTALVVVIVLASLAAEILHGGATVATAPAGFQPIHESALGPIGLAVSPAPSAVTATQTPAPALAAATPTLAPASAPMTADVVRFRPQSGQAGVVPPGQVSVRFTSAMDRTSTQAAFTVTVNGLPVTGRIAWAEGSTVLVFTPAKAIPYGATVQLAVGAAARTSHGGALAVARAATFTVMAKPTPKPIAAPAVASTPKPTPKPAPSLRPVVAKQPPAASAGWIWPLNGPITQYFGQSLTIYGPHQGIDIDGQTGDPVVAARAGTVIAAGYVAGDACGGLQVRVDSGNGFVEWYHHFSRVLVRVGQQVAAGARIGLVGATGCAFGSHLHFAILVRGSFVDPLRYLPRR